MKPDHEHKAIPDLFLYFIIALFATVAVLTFFSLDHRIDKLECQADPVCMEEK